MKNTHPLVDSDGGSGRDGDCDPLWDDLRAIDGVRRRAEQAWVLQGGGAQPHPQELRPRQVIDDDGNASGNQVGEDDVARLRGGRAGRDEGEIGARSGVIGARLRRACASGELGAPNWRAISAPKEPMIKKYSPSVSCVIHSLSAERTSSVHVTPNHVHAGTWC